MESEYVSKDELSFPPYCLHVDHENRIIVTGGGGASKTGIPNQIIVYKMKDYLFKREFEFDTGDKVIMNIDVHPKYNLFACGAESFCQAYSISYKRIDLLKEIQSDFSEKEDDRLQKRVKFLPSKAEEESNESKTEYVATCGVDGFLRIWTFPKLMLVQEIRVQDQEIVDFDITENFVVATTRKSLKIFSMKQSTTENESEVLFEFELIATFTPTDRFNFRDSKFTADKKLLYVAEFLPQKCSQVRVFDTSSWYAIRTKKINFKGEHHTKFALHPSKNLFALGTSEGSLLVFDSKSMKNVLKRKPHNFIITDIRFHEYQSKENVKNCAILSCSADNALISTKLDIKKRSWSSMIGIFIFIVTIAILIEFNKDKLILFVDMLKKLINDSMNDHL